MQTIDTIGSLATGGFVVDSDPMCKDVVMQDCAAPLFKQFLLNEFRKVDMSGGGHITVETCAALIHAIMVMQDGPLVPPLLDDDPEDTTNANEGSNDPADEEMLEQEQLARLAQKEMVRDEHTRSICAMIAKYLASQAHHHHRNHDHRLRSSVHAIPTIPEATTEGVYMHNFVESLPSILTKRAQEVQRFQNSNTKKRFDKSTASEAQPNVPKAVSADESAFWVELPAVGWGVHCNPMLQAVPWDMNPNSIARPSLQCTSPALSSSAVADDHAPHVDEELQQLATPSVFVSAAREAVLDGAEADGPDGLHREPKPFRVLSELGGSPCLSYWYNILTRRSRWMLDNATANKFALLKGAGAQQNLIAGDSEFAAASDTASSVPPVPMCLMPGAPPSMKNQPPPPLKTILAHAYHRARYFSMQKRKELQEIEQQKAARRLRNDCVGISAPTPVTSTSVVLHQQSLDKIGLRWILQKVGLGLTAYQRLQVESTLTWNEKGMVSKLAFLNQLPEVLNHLMFDERKNRQAKAASMMELGADNAEGNAEGTKKSYSHLEPWKDWCVVHRLADGADAGSAPVIAAGSATEQEVDFSFYYNRYTGENRWDKPEVMREAELKLQQEAAASGAEIATTVAAEEPSISEYLGTIFEQTDDDCSGEICKDEFLQLVQLMGMKLSKVQERTMLKLLDVNGDGTITWAEFIQETPKIIVDILGNNTSNAGEGTSYASDPLDDLFGSTGVGVSKSSGESVPSGRKQDCLTTNWVVLHMPVVDPTSPEDMSKPFWFNKLTSEAQWSKPVEVQLLQQVQPDLMDYLHLKFLEADDDLSGSVSKPEFCSLIVNIGVGIHEVRRRSCFHE
jgi:hypothetical protein